MTRSIAAVVAIAYVAVVLAVDTLASQDVVWLIDWQQLDFKPAQMYSWLAQYLPPALMESLAWLRNGDLQRFEVFKFLFWFLVPLLFCLPRLDLKWFGWGRWQTTDLVLLLALALAGMLAMLLIPEVPSLRQRYPGMSLLPLDYKIDYLISKLFWVLSWLLGWELMHRYVMLRASQRLWPAWGWLLVPLSEGLYHLQKPLLEAGGMVLLSLILTQWALRRQNLLLPFLVHLIIEIELLLFLLFA